MSDAVTLTLRGRLDAPVSLHALAPQHLAAMAEADIAALPITMGRQQLRVGDLFDVRGERSARVRILESTSSLHGIGAGMTAGELMIEGDAGQDVGAGMSGGSLHVRGNAGDHAGAAMRGGLLRIDGNAGDRMGAALPGASRGMTGGEILVRGSAGLDTGARVRRGLIVVCGDTGPDTARAMIAGTVIVLGDCGNNAGRGNKRGSIVACGSIVVPLTYRYACTFRPPHMDLTMTYLARHYALERAAGLRGAEYRRYCGDAGDPGKGEILQLVPSV